MQAPLNPESPAPLYHQITEAIRYRIGTGQLKPGDPLSPLRVAALEWEVHLHTVRRAYRELADQGLVEIRGPRGTRVARSPAVTRLRAPSDRLAAFLERTVEEANREFLLSPAELARYLQAFGSWPTGTPATLTVVECTDAQCTGHAAEIEQRWQVRAVPFNLGQSGEPEPGPIVSTYFHFTDVRARWPHRLADVQFLPIQPDPALSRLLDQAVGDTAACTLTVYDRDASQATGVVADLQALLPRSRFQLESRALDHAENLVPPTKPSHLALVTPRVWADLDPTQRESPFVHPVHYVIAPEVLAGMGDRYGWSARGRRDTDGVLQA